MTVYQESLSAGNYPDLAENEIYIKLALIECASMALTEKEKLVAIISNGIAVFSLLQEQERLPPNTTMYDFVLKVIPENLKSDLSVELIDEVFVYVTSAHSS